MKKLRIMWLHSQLTNWFGGTRFVYNTINKMSENHTVNLFVQKSSDEIVKDFKDSQINVKTLSKYSTGDSFFWFNFENQIKREVDFLKKITAEYDVVISSVFPMNVVANSIGIPHIQYIFEPFAFFWDPFMIDKLPLSKKLSLKILRRKFGKLDLVHTQKSAKILTVNSGTQKAILNIYGMQSVPTLLGVDTSFFKNNIDKKLKDEFVNKKIIIHSTDWTPLKRTNWLIDQFIEINSKIDNLVLLITEVTDKGYEKDIVLKKIRKNNLNNIKLCGNVPTKDLPKYYSLADVAVYPGVGEGASSASLFVLECMACEIPAIRTDTVHDEVIHNENGFLFNYDDPVSFQEYVIKLLNNGLLKEQFGKNARRHIIENYSWEKVANIIEKECLSLR